MKKTRDFMSGLNDSFFMFMLWESLWKVVGIHGIEESPCIVEGAVKGKWGLMTRFGSNGGNLWV